MHLSRPHTVFTSPLDLDVLFVLRRTTRPLTGREIERLVDRGSHSGVQKSLQRLVSHGLVYADEAGRALLYTLNQDHLAVPAVEILAQLRPALEARLKSTIEKWEIPPAHVSIFGSAARADGDIESDIDLFIVRPLRIPESTPHWREQLDRLKADVHGWTGNHLAISEVDERELKRLRRDHPPVVDAFATDAITLLGAAPHELLRGGK